MNEALLALEQIGAVELAWKKFRENAEIETIYLRIENVQKAYEASGVVPLHRKLDRLRDVLAPLADHPWGWVRSWWEQKDDSLSQRKSAHLDVDAYPAWRRAADGVESRHVRGHGDRIELAVACDGRRDVPFCDRGAWRLGLWSVDSGACLRACDACEGSTMSSRSRRSLGP
ncbi:MAG: hypothetical protein ACYCVB_08960 [Bacilli bacterium]